MIKKLSTFLKVNPNYLIETDNFVGDEKTTPTETALATSDEVMEVIKAYDNASFKDRNSVRYILRLQLVKEKREQSKHT